MRRFLSLLYIAIFTVLSAESAGPTASEILDMTSAAFQKAKTLAVEYTMTADGHKTKGNITISGDKFKLTSPEMTVWYDGKTQWTYNSDIREVNITEPTPEELADVNPFVIISSFRRNYNARIVKSAPNQYKLDLSPRGDSQMLLVSTATIRWPSIFYRFNKGKTIPCRHLFLIKMPTLR